MKRLFSKIIKMFKQPLQDNTKIEVKVVAQQAADDARRLKYAREREAARANQLKAMED